jgi:DNA uptake protein ComE-like DNA-binding protein
MLVLLLIMGGLTSRSAAVAATMGQPYYPSEVAYADDLRQKVTMPTKVNINTSGLNELKSLPGFNEELALKVMRSRPCHGVQDFYKKMPGLSKKNIELLIKQIEPKIQFK